MQAIETVYNGYRFRSRLEARWAVFFDALEVEYEYEPEGYELSNGQRYLPDFFLPELKIYVEVKSSEKCFIRTLDFDARCEFYGKESKKYESFANDCVENGFGVWFVFGDPMSAIFSESLGENGSNHLFCKLICIAKMFQTNKNDKCVCGGKEKIISKCKKEICADVNICAIHSDFAITCDHPKGTFTKAINALPLNYMIECAEKSNNQSLNDSIERYAEETHRACDKARKARFEYGECG